MAKVSPAKTDGSLGARALATPTVALKPAWLKACNERKAPFTEAELDRFVEDFIAAMHDVKALSAMIESHGIANVKALLKERFQSLDGNNLVNLHLTWPAQ